MRLISSFISSTSSAVFDSSGTNIGNTTINWNDSANANYREQFIAILNAANVTGQTFGSPREKGSIGGVDTEVYTMSSNQDDLPIFGFSASVGGTDRSFEVVPSQITDSEDIYESPPIDGSGLSYCYRTDGGGDSSNNPGYFFLFKQGTLQYTDFNVDQAETNFIQPINVPNINNTDVWLFRQDELGLPIQLWKQVPAMSGNNAIYNSLSAD